MGKLNDRQVRALIAVQGEKLVGDGGGLYLRVRSGGAGKAWVFRFMLNGHARKMQLGFYPDIGLADAREQAASLTALVRRGIDPLKERVAAIAAEQAATEAEAGRPGSARRANDGKWSL